MGMPRRVNFDGELELVIQLPEVDTDFTLILTITVFGVDMIFLACVPSYNEIDVSLSVTLTYPSPYT
ncbi:hypothetical protein CsatB_001280 [Cannabis sativa]